MTINQHELDAHKPAASAFTKFDGQQVTLSALASSPLHSMSRAAAPSSAPLMSTTSLVKSSSASHSLHTGTTVSKISTLCLQSRLVPCSQDDFQFLHQAHMWQHCGKQHSAQETQQHASWMLHECADNSRNIIKLMSPPQSSSVKHLDSIHSSLCSEH